MPKRISNRPTDVNQAAFLQVESSTAELEPRKSRPKPVQVTKSEISRVMSAMGRKGGKTGGKRRMDTMTPEQRKEIAVHAAQTRWEKTKRLDGK